MKKVAFYHTYLDPNGMWAPMFIDQMKLIEDCGLMDELDYICCGAVTTDYSPDWLDFQHLSSLYPKILVENSLGESDTQNWLWNQMRNEKEPTMVLYFHAKGVTSYDRFLKRRDYVKYKNYLYWRKYQEWGTIEKWREAEKILEYGDTNGNQSDTVGCNLCEWPATHYSGGFWWATNELIKLLPDPLEDDWWDNLRDTTDLSMLEYKLKPEFWVTSLAFTEYDTCHFSFHNYQPKKLHGNLAEENIPRKDYINA